jgi:hypothetical protein
MGLSLKRVEDEAYAELDWRTDEIEDEIDEQWDDLEQFEE